MQFGKRRLINDIGEFVVAETKEEALKKAHENLIKYRYFEELSYNEIAEKTQSPLGTIKAQLFRARELLFEILKDLFNLE